MSFLKLNSRGSLGLVIITLLTLSFLGLPFHIAPVAAPSSDATLPIVAIHVSADTELHWTQTSWPYFSIYEMLEEAFRSDGTPFVEISDGAIEAGGLLSSGLPRYPILFSLAAECISDLAVSRIQAYVNAGGFVYVGSSSWTKYPDGSPRTDFALSAQMGLECEAAPPNNWIQVQYATRIADHRLVDHLPYNIQIDWPLPLTRDSSIFSHVHYVWASQNTAADPADVLMRTEGHVMIATKAYSKGQFIYDSVLAQLTGAGATRVHTYAYMLFRKAVEWAFEAGGGGGGGIPLAKLSAWKYQHDAAFIIRHDMCFEGGGNWVPQLPASAQHEKDHGVTGEYYIVTGEILDPIRANPYTPAQLIAYIQDAYSKGALIGSHNGGLPSTPWTGVIDHTAYIYWHWGPDDAIRSYPSEPLYAYDSLDISLDDIQSWVAARPTTFVSPDFNGYLSESLEFYESLGIKTSGEQCIGPFPHWGLSMVEKNKHFDNLVLPPQEFYTSSGSLIQSLNGHSTATVQGAVDLAYSLGTLVNIYNHHPSTNSLCDTYITYCLSKPNMWATTALGIYDWWVVRQQIAANPTYQRLPTGGGNLTVTLSGSTSLDTCLEIVLPVPKAQIANLQVKLDDVISSNFRQTSAGIKVKAGTASKITVTYELQESWTQTSQTDFQSGTLTNLDAVSVPGQLILAGTPGDYTGFSDDFSDPSWTNSHWTTQGLGTWDASGGLYKRVPYAYWSFAYPKDTSWSNYAVETKWRFVSGTYGGGIAARLNPSTGTRYAFWIYPNNPASTKALLAKFGTWETYAPLPGYPSGYVYAGNITTDTNWHTLRMEVYGTSIKCYYDGVGVFNLGDSSYPTGTIDFEDYGGTSTSHYDNVTVSVRGTVFYSSGTLVSSPFDTGSVARWKSISWTASTPTGTQVKFRTKTAPTQADLTSASWSDYYTISDSPVTSPNSRWIQYEATLTTTNPTSSPTLYDVTIGYTKQATIESCDSTGTEKNTFNPGETVYVSGSGFAPSFDYPAYVVRNTSWANSMPIPDRVSGTNTIVSSDSSGNIRLPGYWTQTSQADFQSGTLTHLDAATIPGQVSLAVETTGSFIGFQDDFLDPSWTNSHWTVQRGTYEASDGLYKRLPSADWSYAYPKDTSWGDYTVETKWKYVSGDHGGGIAARLDPSTGTRYAFWIYPNSYGPNKALIAKFADWTTYASDWSYFEATNITTDINWHTLRMEVYGDNIKCFYDSIMVFNLRDSSYPTGSIDLEDYGSSTSYFDDVKVTVSGNQYYSSGTLVSSSFDVGSRALWTTISWSASTPSGTQAKFRTRTASTQADLSSASWSAYYTSSDSPITSPDNRWIQYEATLTTTIPSNTPTLYDLTIRYTQPTPIWASVQPGAYDIIIDVNDNHIYDAGIDAIDDLDISGAGFFVIPEYALGTVLALAVCFAGVAVYRRSKRARPKP